MEPQDSEEGQVSGHGVLGSDVFEEGPMSTMSEAGIPPSPGGSEGSYMSHSPDSLMGTSPFTQRPKKRMRKIQWVCRLNKETESTFTVIVMNSITFCWDQMSYF